MKQRVGNCPACGAIVEFKLSTALVTVCNFCHSVVARADKRLEDHGKMADLVDTNTPLVRGITGTFEKKRFEIVGVVQYQHPAGGVWNEWYLQLPGERVGWLAEAQGKFYMMSRRRLNNQGTLPDYDSLSAGDRVDLDAGKTLVVAEKVIATAVSASGTIPWALQPNAEHRFVDLHGTGNEFATIEYSESGPRLFVGREVSLLDLGLQGYSKDAEAFAPANTKALQVNCPKCAGPLALFAPDQTLRVCCPSCHSLLNCQQGKLQYLQTLQVQITEPQIPLGSVGKLFNTEYTVIGFMVRYAEYKGRVYPWSEYLLYQPAQGFRWLVCNQAHWSFVEPVPVTAAPRLRDNQVTYDDKTFRLYDRGTAFVRYVVGEFYWQVSTAEIVETADYISPPLMLSSERITSTKGNELNVSFGTYVGKDVIETAFGLDELPTAWGVGTIQPKPDYSDVWMLWIGFGVLLFVLNLVCTSLSYSFDQFYFYAALVAVSAPPILLLILNHQFEVSRWQESDYSPYAQAEDEGDS